MQGSTRVQAIDEASAQYIARDLVRAISEIEVLAPESTTVQLRRGTEDGNPFAIGLRNALTDAGYGIQIVASERGENLLRYRVSRSLYADTGPADRFEVSIGKVQLRRDYTYSEGSVEPATAFFIKGAAPSTSTDKASAAASPALDDAALLAGGRRAPNGADMDRPAVAPATHEQSKPEKPGPSASGADEPGWVEGSAAGRRALADVAMHSSEVPPGMRNMVELGSSNYADLVAGLVDVDERTISFRRDSSLLDDRDVDTINSVLAQFDRTRDVISIVGCSLGPGDNNQALAILRASRVKQAFLAVGVPAERLLAEGCWADHQVNDVFPDQGVLMRLLREEV